MKMKNNSIKKINEVEELDRIIKMLVRRDFELMITRDKLEESKRLLEIRVKELEEMVKKKTKDLEEKSKELEETQSALLNILEDVGKARIEAEEEKNKTLAIINNLADGLLVFDTENKLILINPSAENFLKFRAEEIKNRTILELEKLPGFKLLAGFLKQESQFLKKEISLNEDLLLRVSTFPILREEKKLGNLVILHDITREKMIERMKTEFVSLVAHQLRTPLSAIKWTLRMLLDGDLGEITKEQRGFIEKTYESNERMINLINDLLNVARIEEGRYLYKPVLSNFVAICRSVINLFKEEIEKKKIKFEFREPKEKFPQVRVDVEKIKLVIENLVDNAIKYTPNGKKITVSLKFNKKEIEFKIQDSGIGIPKHQQEKVFSKFFRGSNAIRMATGGSGLGLFITKNIIEAHGGKIWFESEENVGTTFYFTLPLENEV